MHRQWSYFLLFITLCLNYCVCKKYYNYTLFRSLPKKTIHLDFLRNMSLIWYDGDFWMPPVKLFKPVDFVLAPKYVPILLEESKKLKLSLSILNKDIQSAFDKQVVKNYTRTKLETFDWESYHRVDDIYKWLQDLAVANPGEMELTKIGTTHENRDIVAVRIKLNGAKKRSKVILEGGIHAREWISPAVVTCLIHQIVNAAKSENKYLRTIANSYEWYFVPVLNPDGYEYTYTTDRLWRKNRNHFGIDLNRNFPQAFGKTGVSFNERSSVYCGPRPFSEKESIAMGNFVKLHYKNLEYYLTFHSYGQYMVLPYFSSKEHLENFAVVKRMCERAAARIKSKYGTYYTVGTSYETVGYTASGSSGCWVKEQFKTPYVITFELRDSGLAGFALPTSQIKPTCLETLDGLISLLNPREHQEFLKTSSSHRKDLNVLHEIIIVLSMLLISIIVRLD